MVQLNSPKSHADTSMDLAPEITARLQKVIEVLRVDGGWIGLDRDCLVSDWVTTSNPDNEPGLDSPPTNGRTLDVACRSAISEDDVSAIASSARDGGLLDRVIQGRETIVADRPEGGSPAIALTLPQGIRTILALPLELQGRVMGLMGLVTRSAHTYSRDDLGLAATAAKELAFAIDHALRFRAQQQRIDRQRLLLEAAETVHRGLDSSSLETTVLAEATRLVCESSASRWRS